MKSEISQRLCARVVFQNRGSSRRRAEPVSIEDQDKPYVCDSKRTEHMGLVGAGSLSVHASSNGDEF